MPTFKVIFASDPAYEQQTGTRKYHDNSAIHDVISYVFASEKTPHHYIGGYGVNLHQAALEMEMLAYAYGKGQGIRLRHSMLSFSQDEVKRFGGFVYETLYKIANFAAAYYGNEYQIIFAVHEKPVNPHIHFVMNTVNYRTGKKYRGDKGDYYRFQSYLSKFLLEQYGLKLIMVKDCL